MKEMFYKSKNPNSPYIISPDLRPSEIHQIEHEIREIERALGAALRHERDTWEAAI